MPHLGLIGYGKVATHHLEVLRDLGGDVVAACNRSEEGRRRARDEGNIPRTYEHIEDMLSTEDLDGVICCPSIYENFSVARRVLPFRIPTLLEKPPGTSLSEIRELVSLQQSHGTRVMVGLNRLWYSVLERALQEAGGPEALSYVGVEWSENPKRLEGRGFSDREISLRTFSNSLHGLSLLTFLAGPISHPNLCCTSLGEPFRWVMSLQGTSERGALVSFESTWDSPAPWRVVFASRDRWLELCPIESCTSREAQGAPTTIEPDEADRRFKPGFHAQGAAFLDMVRGGDAPNRCSLDAVLPAMMLADSLTTACLRVTAARS